MAGRAALRVGAGLVTVATPGNVLPIVAAGMPELMTAPLLSTEAGTASMRNMDYEHFAQIAHGKSVLAIGPGLSTTTETQQFIRAVLETTSLPVVLDADGLNAFAGRAAELLATSKTRLLAITPHPGEMARLLDSTVRDVQAQAPGSGAGCGGAMAGARHPEGFSHHSGDAGRPSLRQHHRQSGHGHRRHRGRADRHAGRADRGIWHRSIGSGCWAWASICTGLAGDLAAAHVGEAPLVASDLIEALPEAFAQLAGGMGTCPPLMISHSPEETVETGAAAWRGGWRRRCWCCSRGELGSGKTTMAKGIVSGLGAAREEDVTSPTFTLVHVFRNHGPRSITWIFTAWRLSRSGIAGALEDASAEPAIVIIEWAERFSLRSDWPRVAVRLEHLEGTQRRISIAFPEELRGGLAHFGQAMP